MGLIQLHAQGLKIDKDAYTDLIHHNFSLSDDHSNGRWVRNLNEKLIRKQAVRLSGKDDVDLTTLTQEDIQAAYL
jgi:stage V sporulation protein K